MPCINLDRIPYLVTYNPEDPSIKFVEGATGISSRTRESFDYYYIQFSCPNSFRIFNVADIIPANVLEKIKSGDVFLVLDNALEPFLKSADSIYQHVVVGANIPAKKIIFMTGIPTMGEYIKVLALKFNQDEINVEWFSMFEHMLHQISHRPQLLTLRHKRYPKKFLNLNRRWRLHRPLLMILLQEFKLIDKGFISFGESDFSQHTWENIWPELLKVHNDNTHLISILNRNESIKQLPPLYLDTNDLVTNRAEHQDSTDTYYAESYFSVVSETTFYNYESPFLSEKVFKAIAYSHPFILVTRPHSLQHLKKLGYKTFEGIIDESYDTEENDSARIIKIATEIHRLANLPKPELIEFLDQAKPICDYNLNILRTKNGFIHPLN